MIGQVAHLGFGQYLLWSTGPVVFAMAAAYAIIWLLSRKNLQSTQVIPDSGGVETYTFNRLHTLKGIIILFIVVVLFFTSLPKEIIVLAAAGIHLASTKYRTEDLLGLVEWPILVLFMGLFVIAGAFQSTGYGDAAIHHLAQAGFNLNAPVNLTLSTALLSNLVGNSAAVMLLLKVVKLDGVVPFLIAQANSFGGSLLIIGSISNIIVVQQARQMGITISFWDFARLGIPVTVASLAGLLAWVALIH